VPRNGNWATVTAGTAPGLPCKKQTQSLQHTSKKLPDQWILRLYFKYSKICSNTRG